MVNKPFSIAPLLVSPQPEPQKVVRGWIILPDGRRWVPNIDKPKPAVSLYQKLLGEWINGNAIN